MRRPPDARAREARKDELARARDHLQRLLSFRPRSIKEARERLKRAGYPDAVIEQVITEGKEHGWLDDAAFAKLWVQERLLTKPKGRKLLIEELRAKGISEEHIEQALREAELDEEKLIQQLIEQHGARYQGVKSERKFYAFLRRRGFSSEAIKRVLRRLQF